MAAESKLGEGQAWINWTLGVGAAVYPEHGNTVVAPVGDIKRVGGGHKLDLRCLIIAGKFPRQRQSNLDRRQNTPPTVPTAGGDGAVELIQNPGNGTVGMERHMAGPGATARIHISFAGLA